jgi:hypothetical protein
MEGQLNERTDGVRPEWELRADGRIRVLASAPPGCDELREGIRFEARA